jgi:hypothetical protein
MHNSALMLLFSLLCAPALAHGTAPCKSTPAIVAGKQIVERAPEVLDTRLNLAELLVDAGCYRDALELLQAGSQWHLRDEKVQTRLRLVRSLLDESRAASAVDEQQARSHAQRSRDALRCTRFSDLTACERSLVDSPGDPALIAATAAARARRVEPERVPATAVTVAALLPAEGPTETEAVAAPPPQPRPAKAAQLERYSNIEPRTRSN